MKYTSIALFCLLVACADRQAVADRDTAKAQVRQMEAQIEADRLAGGKGSQALAAALKEAHEKLLAAEAEVKRSKVASVTGPVSSALETAAPIANGFAPGLGALLVAAAGLIGQFGKKKEA